MASATNQSPPSDEVSKSEVDKADAEKVKKKDDPKGKADKAEGSSPSKYVTRGSSALRQTKEEEVKKIKGLTN